MRRLKCVLVYVFFVCYVCRYFSCTILFWLMPVIQLIGLEMAITIGSATFDHGLL